MYKLEEEIAVMLQEPNYLLMLSENKEKDRGAVTVYLGLETITKMNELTRMFKEKTGQIISKSKYIDVAISNFSNQIEDKLSVKNLAKGNISIYNEVIIFTCTDYNFYDQRLKGKLTNGTYIPKRWSAVSLGKDTIDLINKGVIKFISIYRGKPDQCFEEFAEINRIELITSANLAKDDPSENSKDIGKYRIYIEGNLIKLPRRIQLGSAVARSLCKGKKTTLRNLLTAQTVNQL